MKTRSLFALAALGCILSTRLLGGVTINLTVGVLSGSTGVTMADGNLVMLIASTVDTSFAAPTATSFVSGDDVIVSQFALDSSTFGVSGVMLTPIAFNLSAPLSAGEQLMVRWFPGLSSTALAPGGGTSYGEYRDLSFLIPSDGNTVAMKFKTTSAGGSGPFQPDTAGQASFTVAVGAIPEPSTYALLGGLAVLGLAGWRRRNRA